MNKLKYWIVVLTVFLAALAPINPAGADPPRESGRRLDFGVRVQDYKWAEFADAGGKLLEETGNLFGLTCDIATTRNLIGWRTGGQFFLGEVDYDGRTWTDLPVKTDVFYAGTQFYADVVPGFRLDSGLRLESFFGLGGECWLRNLDDTKTANGDPVRGAEEWWGCVYGRAGAGAEYPVTEDIAVFAEAGIKLPIYARNEANFFMTGSPRAGLEPEPDFSGFGLIGACWKQWGIKVSYDSLRFDRSDTVSSGMFNLYQPASRSDVYSVVIFWSKGF